MAVFPQALLLLHVLETHMLYEFRCSFFHINIKRLTSIFLFMLEIYVSIS